MPKRPYESASFNTAMITVIVGLATMLGIENITPEVAGSVLVFIGAIHAWLRVRTSGKKIAFR
jgi:hypothetical protein